MQEDIIIKQDAKIQVLQTVIKPKKIGSLICYPQWNMANQVGENEEKIDNIQQEFIEMKEEFCPQGDSNYRSVEGLCYYFNPTARTHANAKQKCEGKQINSKSFD